MTDQLVTHYEAIGESSAFLVFQESLSRAAQVDRPVLLIGERGTGKELAAAKLHYLSNRWQGPLVALNCAALSPTLVESELFGHEAGAFTGASRKRLGRFESAHEGTLILDEIAVIPRPVQEKILRVVEYATFERVGGSTVIHTDVRIIGATNANLRDLSEQGVFMRDLLDRLSFEVLFVPPLRYREGDIPILAGHFAARMAREMGRTQAPVFSKSAMKALTKHLWPGNIRELKNVVERAVYRSGGSTITTVDFDPFDSPFAPFSSEPSTGSTGKQNVAVRWATAQKKPQSFTESVRDYEIGLLREALTSCRYNQRKAAADLGLTYHQFRGLYRKYEEAISGQTADAS